MSDKDKLALTELRHDMARKGERIRFHEKIEDIAHRGQQAVVRAYQSTPDPAVVVLMGGLGYAAARLSQRVFGEDRGKTIRLIAGGVIGALSLAAIVRARTKGKPISKAYQNAFYFAVGLVGADASKFVFDAVDKAYDSVNKKK